MRLALLMVAAVLASCSGHDRYQGSGVSLRQLAPPNVEKQAVSEDSQFTTAEIRRLYAAAVASVANRQQQRQIAVRVAELTLAMATEEMTEQATSQMSGEAIAQIESLLMTSAENADASQSDNTALVYQLAQAKQLDGDRAGLIASLDRLLQQQPDNLDARFRRAELRFTDNNYRGAAADYAVVAAAENAYQRHANYMLGWSQFKLGDAERSLIPFLIVIAELASAETIVGAEQELQQDAMRVFQIALDYLDGAQTLAELLHAQYPQLRPDWQIDLYRGLASWYLDKDRVHDSVATWDVFLDNNPLDANAAQVTLDIMATLESAGFVNDREARQQAFIDQFDRRSDFFAQHGEEVFSSYSAQLMQFMEDATARAHAGAQQSEQSADYLLAAAWYGRWLENFPDGDGAADKQFLQAEALFDGQDFVSAIKVLDDYLHHYAEHPSRRAASYRRVLAWQHVLGEQPSTAGESSLVEVARSFVREFPADQRSEDIHFEMMRRQFALQQYDQVTIEAIWAQPVFANGELQGRRQLLSAHAWFELEDFVQAEAGYNNARSLSVEPQADIVERILICAFKQAETAELLEDWASAAHHFNRLIDIDATSEVAIDAQYDLVRIYELLGDSNAAIAQLQQFRERWGQHPASADIAMRLIELYEGNGQSLAAAHELIGVSHDVTQSEQVQQQAVYRAAELFLTANDTENAIDTFRRYAHNYAYPADLNLEAMHHMDLLYQQTNEPSKRRFWLKKKMQRVAELSDNALTDRARFLGGDAALVLAMDVKHRLVALPLGKPIARSLKKKQKLMKQTIKALEKAAGYGVTEVTAAATYEMATSYSDLARSLMASDAPEGLNELEAEQYTILLEEQAFPFEEKAIELHRINLTRGWQGQWNEWTVASLSDLAELSPGHYLRQEMGVADVVASN